MVQAMDRPRPETDRAGTAPTPPTPPPAPALAPVAEAPAALVVPRGWQIEGHPGHGQTGRSAGRGADGASLSRPRSGTRTRARRDAAAVTRFFTLVREWRR